MFIKLPKVFTSLKPICVDLKFPSVAQNFRAIGICSVLKETNKPDACIKDDNLKKFDENEECTWVGPPHTVSNLRLKVFPNSKNLTKEEKFFYEKSRETQEWNQQYWELHNKDFVQSRKSYTKELSKKKNLGPDYTLTMEEMADFYRQFLDKNYKKHVTYNWQWYGKNFELIYLSAKAQLSRLKRLLIKDVS